MTHTHKETKKDNLIRIENLILELETLITRLEGCPTCEDSPPWPHTCPDCGA